jgi:hypothetical protein
MQTADPVPTSTADFRQRCRIDLQPGVPQRLIGSRDCRLDARSSASFLLVQHFGVRGRIESLTSQAMRTLARIRRDRTTPDTGGRCPRGIDVESQRCDGGESVTTARY